MARISEKGGCSPSDPGNKSRDYWRNPTVLKIISSLYAGKHTKKAMNNRTIRLNKGKKIKYLPMGTLNKYLSGGKRFINPKSDFPLKNPTDVKDMIKEGFLIVDNAKPDSIKRLSASKESYNYSVNYDLLWERFISDIDDEIQDAKNKIAKAQNIFNRPENKRRRLILEMEDGSAKEGHKFVQRHLKVCSEDLSRIKLKGKEPQLVLSVFFTAAFKNYYLSGRENLTLLDIFRILEVELLRQNAVEKQGIKKDVFSQLVRALNIIQDIEFGGTYIANTDPLEYPSD